MSKQDAAGEPACAPADRAATDHLQQLLANVNEEFARLCRENTSLQQQLARLRPCSPCGSEAEHCPQVAAEPALQQPHRSRQTCSIRDPACSPGRSSFAGTWSSATSQVDTPSGGWPVIAQATRKTQIQESVKQQLREQFDRVSDLQEKLSAQKCWGVVSNHEHQVYGHSKHSVKKVARTLRCIQAMMGRPDEDLLPELDFESFLLVMTSEDDLGGGEGDLEYMRRAFRAEATEYMAEMARKSIEKRAKEESDPVPEGWRLFLLEHLPPMVICANAVVLGLQADIERKSMVWDVLEVVFLAFYVLELLLKLRFLGWFRFLRGQDWRWNWFDLACVLLSMAESAFRFLDSNGDDVTLLKMLRLARLARIVKSFRYKFCDDLKVMALGILSGARVLAWAALLFFMCVYIIGITMRELFEDKNFSTVPGAMFTVFRCFTDGCSDEGGAPLHEKMRQDYGGPFIVGYILIFLVVTFGIFNLIMAVFIESVSETTTKRKQQDLGKREAEMKLRVEELFVRLLRAAQLPSARSMASCYTQPKRAPFSTMRIARSYSPDLLKDFSARQHDVAAEMSQLREEKVQISRGLFNAWLADKEVLGLLEEMEIDTATKAEIFDVCDVDRSGSLTCQELVGGLMRLRGPISKCDVIATRLKVRYLTNLLEDIHHTLVA